MATLIQLRRDTVPNWASVNPILAQGEIGLELGTDMLKIGDGVTQWNNLEYFASAIPQGMTLADVGIEEGQPGQFLVTDGAGNHAFADLPVDNNTFVSTVVFDDLTGDMTVTMNDGTVHTVNYDGRYLQIANLPAETITSISFANDTISYVDEAGNQTDLDLSAYVNIPETVTTLVDNGDETFTYTSEDGTVTTVDFTHPADVVTTISFANDTISYTDEVGTQTDLDLSAYVNIPETVTSLVDNGDNTLTYTAEDGTATVINLSAYLDDTNLARLVSGSFDPATGLATFSRDDASTFDLDLSALFDDVTVSITGTGATTVTGTYPNFTVSSTDTTYTNVSEFTNDAGYITAADVPGNETVTTLVDNGNDTFTYTSEDGTVTTVDFTHPADVVTTLSLASNILSYVDEAGNQTDIDLSLYIDDTNLARLTSGTLDGVTGIATFTRDDASTFTVDMSALLDDVTVSITGAGATTVTGTYPNFTVTSTDTTYTNVSEFTNDAGYITLADVPAQTPETVTSLVDNGDLTVTYTDEAGTATTIDHSIILNEVTDVNALLTTPSVPAGITVTGTAYDGFYQMYTQGIVVGNFNGFFMNVGTSAGWANLTWPGFASTTAPMFVSPSTYTDEFGDTRRLAFVPYFDQDASTATGLKLFWITDGIWNTTVTPGSVASNPDFIEWSPIEEQGGFVTISGTTGGTFAFSDGGVGTVTETISGTAVVNYTEVVGASVPPNDGNVLTYNATDAVWEPRVVPTPTFPAATENVIYVKAGEAIAKGDLLMFGGAQGDHIVAVKCNAQSVGFKDDYVIGVASQDLAVGEFGNVTTFGIVEGIDTSLLPDGTILYMSNTVIGGLDPVVPQSPEHTITVAAVTRSNANNGAIFVRLTTRGHIGDLYDVSHIAATDGQQLVWNDTNKYWEPTTISSVGSVAAPTAPANPDVGQLWYETVFNGRLYVWNGTEWVDAAPIAPSETYNLNDLSDVDLTAGTTSGDVLSYDGTKWVSSAPAAGGANELTDLTDITFPSPLSAGEGHYLTINNSGTFEFAALPTAAGPSNYEPIVTATNNIDFANPYHVINAGGIMNIGFTFPTDIAGFAVTTKVRFSLGGAATAINLPGTIKWDGGVAPTFSANTQTIVEFMTDNAGTTVYAKFAVYS